MKIAKQTIKLLFGCLLFTSSPAAHAFITDLDATISQNLGCAGCHGAGTPQQTAGFALLDPATNTAVTRYEPGKTYTIRMSFAAQAAQARPAGLAADASANGNGFVVAYHIRVLDVNFMPVGTIVPPVAGVKAQEGINVRDRYKITDDNAQIVRHFRSATAAGANNVTLSWQAPAQAAGAITFQYVRAEPNGNWNGTGGNDNGDRLSRIVENNAPIQPPLGTANPTPIPGASPNPGSTGSSTGGQTGLSSKSFSGDFQGGCGLIEGNALFPTFAFLVTIIVALAGLLLLRKRA